LVDGGAGQLGVAERVVASLGLTDQIPVAALAKRYEQVYRPGSDEPIDLPRGSEALYLLQRLRDESHRFAVAYHRQLRSKRMTGSVLDGIPGLGPSRKKRLTSAFGGVRAVERASLEDLIDQPWLPEAVAMAIFDRTHGQG
jgi:excinuclease ABC subunit C